MLLIICYFACLLRMPTLYLKLDFRAEIICRIFQALKFYAVNVTAKLHVIVYDLGDTFFIC